MGYFILKAAISGLLVAGISSLSARYGWLSALLASLPLTSVLAFCWMYYEQRDRLAVAGVSADVFWLVIPSLVLFPVLAVLLRESALPFWLALVLAMLATLAAYGLMGLVRPWR